MSRSGLAELGRAERVTIDKDRGKVGEVEGRERPFVLATQGSAVVTA